MLLPKLLSGAARENWQDVISSFSTANQKTKISKEEDREATGSNYAFTEKSWDSAMERFSLRYAPSRKARQEQIQYMTHITATTSATKEVQQSVRKYSSIKSLWCRLQQMNQYIPYLPGEGTQFSDEQMRQMLISCVSPLFLVKDKGKEEEEESSKFLRINDANDNMNGTKLVAKLDRAYTSMIWSSH